MHVFITIFLLICVFFLITGFGNEMEESGLFRKNLVEVILVQEEEEEEKTK